MSDLINGLLEKNVIYKLNDNSYKTTKYDLLLNISNCIEFCDREYYDSEISEELIIYMIQCIDVLYSLIKKSYICIYYDSSLLIDHLQVNIYIKDNKVLFQNIFNIYDNINDFVEYLRRNCGNIFRA